MREIWLQRHTQSVHHVTTEAEMGVMHLQTKGRKGWPATTRRWVRGRDRLCPRGTEGANLASTLIWDFQSPELWEVSHLVGADTETWTESRIQVGQVPLHWSGRWDTMHSSPQYMAGGEKEGPPPNEEGIH